jgi:GT2 family glycosyltransferase
MTPPELYEVVLVDNASSDGTADLLAALDGDVTIIRNEVNQGFARASNQGAAAARGRHLLFLNNDTELHPGWLEPVVEILDREPDVGAVGALLLFPDGLVQHAGVTIVEFRDRPEPIFGGVHASYRSHPDAPGIRTRRDVRCLTAALLGVRREAFEAAGGFDEGFWNGNEDVDLCLRLNVAGWRLVYEPACVATHHESVSGPERFSRLGDNERRLTDRWLGTSLTEFVVKPDCTVVKFAEV